MSYAVAECRFTWVHPENLNVFRSFVDESTDKSDAFSAIVVAATTGVPNW